LKERHFFAGNNTGKGFYSYFDHIINLEEANHYYILKGGPGVGKSSFMKKFAQKMASMGHAIEYVHCSSDKESLDAIVIPALKIGFVDGTAPHTIDPKYPGAVDEIINLGYFFDGSQIAEHKKEVIQTSKEKSNTYKSAYRYLGAASFIQDDIDSIYDSFTDKAKLNRLREEVKNELFQGSVQSNTKEKLGRVRKLFSESYTADGYISFTASLCEGAKVWAIVGKNINSAAKLLDAILKEAISKGYDTECFYRPLTPEKLQHIFIPELNLMIRSLDHSIHDKFDKVIDLDQVMDTKALEAQASKLHSKEKEFENLIHRALEKLSETKKLHGKLERIYAGSMDFRGVDQYFDTLFARYK
jgi:KaiC/GvpD/RAD55 family RecA-like ATPase